MPCAHCEDKKMHFNERFDFIDKFNKNHENCFLRNNDDSAVYISESVLI